MNLTILAEIIMLDGLTCVYRSNVDLFFYVVSSSQENEVKYVIHHWSHTSPVRIFYNPIMTCLCSDHASQCPQLPLRHNIAYVEKERREEGDV